MLIHNMFAVTNLFGPWHHQ